MGHFWNEKAETLPREDLAVLQLQKLKQIIGTVYTHNELYRTKMDKIGIKPDDIQTLEDINKLPFMNKEDFRKGYPLQMLCADRSELLEMHMSSGSTGTPVVMAYTQEDLDQWSECMARCLYMAGLEKSDAIQITPSFGLFNGGFGFFHGASKAGMFIIPAGAGNTPRQIKLMNDFKVKGLMSVVSYGTRIMEILQEQKAELPWLRIGIFGAETFSESMKKKLETGLGIEAFDIYGMTETGGVGTTGMDCQYHQGIHVWEDQYIVEIVDPKTGMPVEDGKIGEVTFTSLNRKAIPIIRFRTGDISRIVTREKCECGRTGLRLARVSGRLDDMLIVKGVNFFPRQVEQALLEIPGVLPNYQIIIEDHHGVRDVRVHVEAENGVTGYMVEKHLKEALGFSPKGDIFKPGTLPRREGKAVRVVFETDEDPKK